jgi:DNA-binding response OmpR family regulator
MNTEKTILIAEPSGMLFKGLKPFLSENGLSAVRAGTQKETLLTLQRRRVHVMILDADLLEEDCAFISIVKGMGEGLPIIICAETNTPEFESFGIQDLEMAVSNAILKVSQQLGGPQHVHR